ncbi:glycosyltransferase family 2 protein [Algoriphagus sp. SE2]|uniref:glycosyltransferase family 2 protein n=1 Tax=Algoriphagus sp. SE2 TaxID=3141536 RepID=UPI0031CCDAFF
MKVSIIIPSFNNSDFISETISSVLAQTYVDFECIVVDDGSEDDTKNQVSKFIQQSPNVQLFDRPKDLPKGANSCRNFGASKSKGELLLFLDADDLLTDDCLEKRLSNYGGEDLLVGSTGSFSNSKEANSPFFKNLNPNLPPQEYRNMFLEYLIPWHTSSGIWKKDFFELIGGFNPNLLRFQDVEIHVRALNNSGIKLKMECSEKFTSLYRQSDFHKKITLAKRRFILEEGFKYIEIVWKTVGQNEFSKIQGLLVYLLFRFEEVIEKADLVRVKSFTIRGQAKRINGFNSIEFKMLNFVFAQLIKSPNRVRKYLSYALYLTYFKRKRSEFLA